MAFETASISNPGGRTVNEDHCGYLEAAGAGCWVVADGLGGHGGGAAASGLAVDAVLSSFRANPGVTPDALRSHLVAAHRAILQRQSEPALSQMRSTIVVLLANAGRAISGHLGDSRLYQFRNGAVEFQTVDHSVPGALAASGAIRNDDIRFHEDRNRVLRSLGNEDEINPAIVEVPLRPGDAFLLCTDGFWEWVTELEMQTDAVKVASPGDWLRFMSSRLLHRAKPENDNWTAIAVFVPPNGAVTQFRGAASAPDRRPMGIVEKVSWAAVACLTVTLLFFLVIALYPQRLAALLTKSPRVEATRKKRGETRERTRRKETAAPEKTSGKSPDKVQ
ncbi:MAG TPA: protein phosphatase 2C domain-containing protein [Verrucomicrobiae bacterium]|nr:protein phosphatase 2C domain-containing protein [Verrucomicrobiae bacterium]